MTRFILCTVALVVASSPIWAAPVDLAPFVSIDAPVIVLEHVRLIDGTGSAAREDQTLVVDHGRIAAMGAHVMPPVGARVIDLRGDTIIPGLVGMHDHLFYPAPHPSDMSLEVAYTFPALYLASGVTTIRTAGSIEPYTDLEVKRRIDEGKLPGPNIHITGPFLEGVGAWNPQMHQLRDAEDARATVSFWASQGVTSRKAYMHITRAELAATIDAAHKLGQKVTGHLCSVGYHDAVALGIDNLEHGPYFSDAEFTAGKKPDTCPPELDRLRALMDLPVDSPKIQALIRDLVSHHVAVTSTLAVFEAKVPNRPSLATKMSWRSLGLLIPQLQFDNLAQRAFAADPESPEARTLGAGGPPRKRVFALEMAFERAFVRAGGQLLAGADPTGYGGVLAGFADQRELELLVEAGFTPLEAIRIGTSNGADFLGESRDIGTLAVGKRADIVAVHGRPDEKIDDLENVVLVFKNGVGYDPVKLIDSVRGTVGLR